MDYRVTSNKTIPTAIRKGFVTNDEKPIVLKPKQLGRMSLKHVSVDPVQIE